MDDNKIHETHEKTYWNKEVAELLGVGDSTLRRWSIELEKNGYIFLKDNQDNRAFTDHDVIAIRKLKELIHVRKMTIVDAINSVISTFSRSSVNERTTAIRSSADRSDYVFFDKETMNKILEKQELQDEFNKKLLERLDEQQSFIENTIKARDEHLMRTLREIQETKMLIAAAQEKKKWWKFW